MQLIYACEPIPDPLERASLFLVGPTPRSPAVPSWRPAALECLESLGFTGTVLIPEPRSERWVMEEFEQVEWERNGLERCGVIAAWVCRNLETLPGFTTNVEFGRYVTSGRFFYGRPPGAAKTRYLDWHYRRDTGREPVDSLSALLELAVQHVV